MKKLTLWVFTLTFLMFASCSKERGDLSSLLKTVPSSAGAVIGIHLSDLIEDCDSKIDNNRIKPGKDLEQILSNMSETNKNALQALLNGDTGLSLENAVVFYDSSRCFLTGFVYDTNKFTSFVEQEGGETFHEENGVQIMGNTALKGTQFWLLLSSGRRIDPDGISGYASLSESQSFLNTDMAKVLLESDDDIVGWANFNTMTSNFLSRGNAMTFSLAAGLVFEDVDACSFTFDFDKGDAEFELKFLNDKGKPAKCLIPLENIDTKAVAGIGGSCDMLTAFTITPKTIQKLDKIAGSFGGAILGDVKELLKNIDGTVAVAFGPDKNDFSGVITTSGPLSSDLKALISQTAKSSAEDGKYYRFSKGEVTGQLEVAKVASKLNGYCMASVCDMKYMQNLLSVSPQVAANFSEAVAGLKTDDGSIKIKVEVTAVDKKRNILLSLLQALM